MTLLFFGFTRLPEHMFDDAVVVLKKVRDAVGPLARERTSRLLSVDPDADTPDILRAYVETFLIRRFHRLTARETRADWKKRWKAFRAIAIRVPTADGSDYTVDHSATIFVYDRTGALRLIAQPQLEVEKLAADVTRLVRE
jgi:protein SCO1/2